MVDPWIVAFVLAAATFGLRLSGVYLGQNLPRDGRWARALNALPGCLIIALVSGALLSGGLNEWLAGTFAVAVAVVTRNLPLTMGAGILAIWFLRNYT